MSKYRGNMSSLDRAKQFAPFAALKGHEMELAKKREAREDRIILAEDEAEYLNEIITNLEVGDEVEVMYYKKNVYDTLSGCVEKIFQYEKALQIKNQKIKFVNIYRIKKRGL